MTVNQPAGRLHVKRSVPMVLLLCLGGVACGGGGGAGPNVDPAAVATKLASSLDLCQDADSGGTADGAYSSVTLWFGAAGGAGACAGGTSQINVAAYHSAGDAQRAASGMAPNWLQVWQASTVLVAVSQEVTPSDETAADNQLKAQGFKKMAG